MRGIITLLFVALISNTVSAAETIRSRSGATARVSAAAAPKFQALVDWLDARGYVIRFMGGIRPGRCSSRHMHPCGTALDINQTARGRITRSFPVGVDDEARSLGLVHGAWWSNQDRGHFQVGGYAGDQGRRRIAVAN